MARANARISAVMLAAGKSARMGEPKQLLRLNGRTVLEQTLENVRASGVDEVVLVLGASAEKIRGELRGELFDGLKVAVNQNYAQGMASSLRVGLATASPQMDAALVVLADQPFVRPETMQQIIKRYRRSDAEIVIPFYEGKRGNPVLLDRSVFPDAMALEGDIGFRALFGKHTAGIVEMNVADEGVLLDIDSREDYERLRSREG